MLQITGELQTWCVSPGLCANYSTLLYARVCVSLTFDPQGDPVPYVPRPYFSLGLCKMFRHAGKNMHFLPGGGALAALLPAMHIASSNNTLALTAAVSRLD